MGIESQQAFGTASQRPSGSFEQGRREYRRYLRRVIIRGLLLPFVLLLDAFYLFALVRLIRESIPKFFPPIDSL